MILKGAMLFQVWSGEPYRATRDMDFLASGDVTPESIVRRIQAICNTRVEDDGLEFDLGDLKVEPIREDTEYGGIRARFIARLGSAKIPIQLDFGVGDAVSPVTISYPSLLDLPEPEVLAYPPEVVVAEKLDVIVNLGMANSRMKDYYDLWFIVTTAAPEAGVLAMAVKQTFDRRGREIPIDVPSGLSDEFADDPAKRSQWKAGLRRFAVEAPELDEVVALVREFAMPAFLAARE